MEGRNYELINLWPISIPFRIDRPIGGHGIVGAVGFFEHALDKDNEATTLVEGMDKEAAYAYTFLHTQQSAEAHQRDTTTQVDMAVCNEDRKIEESPSQSSVLLFL